MSCLLFQEFLPVSCWKLSDWIWHFPIFQINRRLFETQSWLKLLKIDLNGPQKTPQWKKHNCFLFILEQKSIYRYVCSLQSAKKANKKLCQGPEMEEVASCTFCLFCSSSMFKFKHIVTYCDLLDAFFTFYIGLDIVYHKYHIWSLSLWPIFVLLFGQIYYWPTRLWPQNKLLIKKKTRRGRPRW